MYNLPNVTYNETEDVRPKNQEEEEDDEENVKNILRKKWITEKLKIHFNSFSDVIQPKSGAWEITMKPDVELNKV